MQNKPRIVYTRPIRRIAKRNPVTIALPLLALGAFIWLAIYSQAHTNHGYSPEDVRALNTLVESLNNAKKPVSGANERRAAIMDIYNISEADVSAPVILW